MSGPVRSGQGDAVRRRARPPRHSEPAVLDGMSVREERLDQYGSADALAVLGLGDDVPRLAAEAME
ncbi:hypothetical protein SUDANB120_05298 [Streptomyces sp. enrichment culture]